MDVVVAVLHALQLHELGDLFVHLPGAKAAPGGDDERLVVQTQGLSRVLPFGKNEFLSHRHADGDDPFCVFVFLAAFGKADQYLIYFITNQPRCQARNRVCLVEGGGDAVFDALTQNRIAGIAAGTQDHVGLIFLDDAVCPPQSATDDKNRLGVVPQGRRRQAAQIVGNMDCFDGKALPGHQFRLHTVVGADKQDLAVGLALLQYFSNSNGGVDMAPCSAAGEDDSHGYSPLFRTLRDAPGNIEHDAALGKLHDERRPSRGEKRQ